MNDLTIVVVIDLMAEFPQMIIFNKVAIATYYHDNAILALR